ncbi:COP9 signalosome complex subunit 8-like [Acanthaster planci]|uniref:COP9 signalosome complex subunit 8 n=1 Tax=Acanthaster planci TaxID=133434 RepID=A0A8B7XGK1_ACAPL|nr:COP9 signalosome complex subunit 8-like [Acanthaster planci]
MAAALDAEKLLVQCEAIELEAPGGVATPEVYSKLLALYLLNNDMNNAKFLWKRIPQPIKTANPEVGLIWAVGQSMWQRNFPATYTSLGREWSEAVKPIMEAITENIRQRMFHLISQGYTSIEADEFAAYVGLPVDQAIAAVKSEGWQYNAENKMISPQKPVAQMDQAIPSEQHIAQLTDFVSFLEN